MQDEEKLRILESINLSLYHPFILRSAFFFFSLYIIVGRASGISPTLFSFYKNVVSFQHRLNILIFLPIFILKIFLYLFILKLQIMTFPF